MYENVFKAYLDADLIKHKSLTPNMKKAIDTAIKQHALTETDLINIINRHKSKYEATKNSNYPIRIRSLVELFGQKKNNGVGLICSDYLDEVWAENNKQSQKPQGTIKDGVKYEGGLRVYE